MHISCIANVQPTLPPSHTLSHLLRAQTYRLQTVKDQATSARDVYDEAQQSPATAKAYFGQWIEIYRATLKGFSKGYKEGQSGTLPDMPTMGGTDKPTDGSDSTSQHCPHKKN
jgi:hypothetical protein